MRTKVRSIVLSLSFLSLIASAASAKAGVTLSEGRILIPIKGTTVTAGYGTLKNESDQETTLKIKSVKPFKAAELHETFETDGKVGMRKIEQIVIPARQTFEFKPGGNHIMLFEPTRPLKVGDQLAAEFDENGKTVTLKFKVVSRDKSPADHSHHDHHHD